MIHRHDYRVFSVNTVTKHINGIDGTFYQIDAPDWVAIIAEADGLLLVESQYRIGTEEMTLEFPGGVIEEGEDPVRAAVRELQEETGYTGTPAIIGTMRPNPALMTNRCTTVAVTTITQTMQPSLDVFEDIQVSFMTPAAIDQAITDGSFSNALHIAAFYQWQQKR